MPSIGNGYKVPNSPIPYEELLSEGPLCLGFRRSTDIINPKNPH